MSDAVGGVTSRQADELPLDVGALRLREFPWAERDTAIFLNAASTGPLPQRCIDAVTRWTELRATPHELTDETLFDTLAQSRELVSRLIGAAPKEIALAVNTGYGLNLAARALPFVPGDVILTPDQEFPANVYPWWAAANERDLEYRRIPLEDGILNEDTLLAALDKEDVRCVSVSWVDSANGCRVDLHRIGQACRERGIVVARVPDYGETTVAEHTFALILAPSRASGPARSTCRSPMSTFSPVAHRNGCCHRGAADSCTCARSWRSRSSRRS